MIKELSIKNFRSIREATLELGRFTVLTGANNSGKSSVLYALQVLKNVVTNPNRSVDELLNLGFLNLGGVKEIAYQGEKIQSVNLSISTATSSRFAESTISVSFNSDGKSGSLTSRGIEPYRYIGEIFVSFPYPLNKKEIIETRDGLIKINWNGITGSLTTVSQKLYEIDEYEYQNCEESIEIEVNLPSKSLSTAEIIPTSRGFTKPIFNTVPLNGHIYTEDEVATLLAIDKDVQAKVAFYFEKITGKRFSISIQPGMGFFYMQVREADGSFSTELVNQGMGMNQIVFLLAKILYGKNRLICIDEPEIHLHPALIEQFVRVLVEIAEKEDKQFIFSTHSEHWLLSLLAEVNDGKLAAEDLKVYYLQKNDQETSVEQQEVMPNGQLVGGLKNFMESQMSLAERFFDTTTA